MFDGQISMAFPHLFTHIDGIEAVLILDKDSRTLLKFPTDEAVDQLDLQSLVPTIQLLQDQSSRINLKTLKTSITYWSTRQIITYNVPPFVFILAADTNVNTGALVNLYNDFQILVSNEMDKKI